jgi:hypothetical protein
MGPCDTHRCCMSQQHPSFAWAAHARSAGAGRSVHRVQSQVLPTLPGPAQHLGRLPLLLRVVGGGRDALWQWDGCRRGQQGRGWARRGGSACDGRMVRPCAWRRNRCHPLSSGSLSRSQASSTMSRYSTGTADTSEGFSVCAIDPGGWPDRARACAGPGAAGQCALLAPRRQSSAGAGGVVVLQAGCSFST